MTDWEGRAGRECGEHRTTGERAWCHDCAQWCYRNEPCARCELPALRSEVGRLRQLYADHRAVIEAQDAEMQRLRRSELLATADRLRRVNPVELIDRLGVVAVHTADHRVYRLQDVSFEVRSG